MRHAGYSGAITPSRDIPRAILLCVQIVDRLAAITSFVGLVAATLCLAMILGFTTASVLARHTGWFRVLSADELSSYALAGIFFLALAHTFRVGAFVRINFIFSRLRARPFAIASSVLGALALATTVVLTYYAWYFIKQAYDFGTISIGTLEVKLWIPELLMGIGMTLLCLELLAYFVRSITAAIWPTSSMLNDVHHSGHMADF